MTSRQTVFKTPDPPNKQRMTVDEMLRAAFQLGKGNTMREIGQSLQRSPTTIHKIKKRVLDDTEFCEIFDYKPAIIAHFVAWSLFLNPQASGRAIADELGRYNIPTSKASVNRIAQELKFQTTQQQKQEQLTELQMKYRVEFCLSIRMWIGYLLPWVFSDECMLVLNPEKRKIRVLRGLDHDDKYVNVSGYPAKVMVWGCIGPNFKGPLLRIRGNLNADNYQNLLQDSQIFEKLRERYGTNESFVFQQDGARPHTAKTTREFLAKRAVLLPQEVHWPANSPDLNVIENLWAIIKHEVNYTVITDGDSLFKEAARVWDSVSLTVINNLVGDFEPRLRACVAVQGQCLNRYKPVLRGYRLSQQSGDEEVQRLVSERQMMDEFIAQSTQFFDERREQFPLTLGVNHDSTSIYEKEQTGRLLWEASCQIIRLLPLSVRNKCGLPWEPKRVTKVPVPELTLPDSRS